MSGKFILNILGSASAKPSMYRESSAQILQVSERLFLIDCSEGVQKRIIRQNHLLRDWCSADGVQGVKRLSKTQLDAIFITHAHGDHIFGLFPLLNTMALSGRTKPLKIFGPTNVGPIMNFYDSFWGEKGSFDIEFIQLKMKKPETVLETKGVQVLAFPLRHGIDCYGFLFRETAPCIFKKQEYKPRSFAYCSDTAYFPELADWVKGVDVLYHEATYMQADSLKAHSRFHSTTTEAAKCALDAAAGRLLVGHYSSSIKEESIQADYLAEAKSVFAETTAVNDGDIFDLPLQMLR